MELTELLAWTVYNFDELNTATEGVLYEGIDI